MTKFKRRNIQNKFKGTIVSEFIDAKKKVKLNKGKFLFSATYLITNKNIFFPDDSEFTKTKLISSLTSDSLIDPIIFD